MPDRTTKSRKIIVDGKEHTIPNDGSSEYHWKMAIHQCNELRRKHEERCAKLGITPKRHNYEGN